MAKDLPSLDIMGSLSKAPNELPRTQLEQPGAALKLHPPISSTVNATQSLEVSASAANSQPATSYSSLFDMSKIDGEGTGQNLTSTPSSFWKDGQGSHAIDSLMAGATGMTQSKFGSRSSTNRKIVLLVAGLVVVGVSGVFLLAPEVATSLTGGLFGSNSSEDVPLEAPLEAPVKPLKKEAPKQEVVSSQTPSEGGSGQIEGILNWKENPYWNLPNGFDVSPTPPSQQWNAQQEDVWSSSVTGPKMWPRYMSLFEIRKMPLAGAEKVLWEFSVGKKFWLRMMALMALADFGEVVELGHVEQAISNVHPELLSRFVSRFEKSSTNGERFILRYLIRLVNEDTRLAILKGFYHSSDKFSKLYLAAGVFDPGSSVAHYSRAKSRQLSKAEMERYSRVVQGLEAFEQKAEPKAEVPAPGAASTPQVHTSGVTDVYNTAMPSSPGAEKIGVIASEQGSEPPLKAEDAEVGEGEAVKGEAPAENEGIL